MRHWYSSVCTLEAIPYVDISLVPLLGPSSTSAACGLCRTRYAGRVSEPRCERKGLKYFQSTLYRNRHIYGTGDGPTRAECATADLCRVLNTRKVMSHRRRRDSPHVREVDVDDSRPDDDLRDTHHALNDREQRRKWRIRKNPRSWRQTPIRGRTFTDMPSQKNH